LVELLIVVALIGVLTATVITLVNPATHLKRGRDTQRKSDLARIQSAFEIFKADMGLYPIPIPACGNNLIGGTSTYLRRYPCDPLTPPTTPYFYSANATFSSYCYRACLENLADQDTDLIKYGTNNPSNAVTGCNFNIATQVCNTATRRSYTVQSP
jgi:type II secretory pathway pseudopilin PulG